VASQHLARHKRYYRRETSFLSRPMDSDHPEVCLMTWKHWIGRAPDFDRSLLDFEIGRTPSYSIAHRHTEGRARSRELNLRG